MSKKLCVIIVGLGVQGQKRWKVAKNYVTACVDPFHDQAEFKSVTDVPLNKYNAALVCTPDEAKFAVIKYLLSHGKHVFVEKPLITDVPEKLEELNQIAEKNGVVCYTAYNHRFEPHIIRMKNLIERGSLGKIYSLRMFYGNGTARLVRESSWRDQAAGVLPDLGSHLLDTVKFWLGNNWDTNLNVVGAHRYENKSFDHFIIGNSGSPDLQLEMSLLSWRNHFTADVYAEKGSAHIESLCKWGPSKFIHRERVLPSGRPPEDVVVLEQEDPTWALEYDYFRNLIKNGELGNLENDMWLNSLLSDLARQSGVSSIVPEVLS
jgi:predicted dehydrogenase